MGDSSDVHGRTPARDHDGYTHAQHFFGDACPGGHLDAIFDTELRPYSTHNDPWLGQLGQRDQLRPFDRLNDEERKVAQDRAAETFWIERHARGEVVGDVHYHGERRKKEERLSRLEEDWDACRPDFDPE